MTAVFGVVGWKNSGKTTLVARLVEEFSKRGLAVSTIKHAHHAFQLDQPGTDTSKHREAGAHEVVIVSQNRWAIMHEVKSSGAEPSLKSMIAKMAPCDLIIVEGYKDSDIPKIESIRSESATEKPLWLSRESVVAIATDKPDSDCAKPQFGLNDAPAIADYITQKLGLRT